MDKHQIPFSNLIPLLPGLQIILDPLTESLGFEPTKDQIIFSTMEEETDIIHEIIHYFGSNDIDIMEYTIHAKMEQNEDDNFITKVTFTLILILN